MPPRSLSENRDLARQQGVVVILWARPNSLGSGDEQDLSGVGRGLGVAAAAVGARLRAMVALLLYAYTQGVYASRRIAKACEERLDVMAVTGMQRPDFRTISEFRRRHLEALTELFVQVLRLCREAGLIKLGHVALDGTKLAANASKHKAMSYGRMARAEAELAAEVAAGPAPRVVVSVISTSLLSFNRNKAVSHPTVDRRRRERIRAAKAALEAEAQAEAPPPDAEPGPSSGMSDRGRPRRAQDGGPPARAQRNFTDPDSRVMKTRDGFVQGYNGQLAVDATHQIIVAQRLTTNGSDQAGLVPLLDAATAALGRTPREVSADAGFCREDNLAALEARGIRATWRRAGPATAAPIRAAGGSSSPARAWPRWRRS